MRPGNSEFCPGFSVSPGAPFFAIEKAWCSLDKLVFGLPPRLPRIGRCGAGRTRV